MSVDNNNLKSLKLTLSKLGAKVDVSGLCASRFVCLSVRQYHDHGHGSWIWGRNRSSVETKTKEKLWAARSKLPTKSSKFMQTAV